MGMRCPVCCVGELQKRWVRGLTHLGKQWLCTDVGRGWNTNYSEREVTQFGYCGISFGRLELLEILREENRNMLVKEAN